MTLHQRIAEALGWSMQDVRSLSLASLRDLVQDPELRADITRAIARGDHLVGATS